MIRVGEEDTQRTNYLLYHHYASGMRLCFTKCHASKNLQNCLTIGLV